MRSRTCGSLVIATVSILLLAGSVAAQICPGDCNSDRRVTVDELVTGIASAFGQQPAQRCFAFTGFRPVNVASIVTAIDRMLNGCGLESLEDMEQQRLDNLAKWQSNGIDDYEINYQRRCFCYFVPDGQVRVEDGTIVAVRDPETGNELDNPHPDSITAFKSIDGVFEVIASAIQRHAVTLDVVYNPQFGYPEHVSIDYVAEIADEEITINIRDLRPLQSGTSGSE